MFNGLTNFIYKHNSRSINLQIKRKRYNILLLVEFKHFTDKILFKSKFN